MIIKGIDAHTKKINIITEVIINIYRVVFSANLKFLNFKFNNFTLVTNKILIIIVNVSKTKTELYTLYILMCIRFCWNFADKGIDATNIANAGVGNPLNSCDWSVILNIANLIAENTMIINERKGKIGLSDTFFIKENITNVGASPKLTTSDRESNSFPNIEVALSFLAKNPSKKSKTDAIKINIADI